MLDPRPARPACLQSGRSGGNEVSGRVRYYIGLAATLHDSAIAIVDSSGRVVFAEATERFLQNKRAYNCPPDDMLRIGRLVKEYCPPEVEIVVAISWSEEYLRLLQECTKGRLPL